MKKEIISLCIAVFLSIILWDAVLAFADVFLPWKTLRVQIAEPVDGHGQYVRMVREGKEKKSLFDLFYEEYKSRVDRGEETGWEYSQGESGTGWTHLSSASQGASLSIVARESPDVYFTVIKSRWNSALIYETDETGPVIVDCFDEKSEGDLLRIYPFRNSNSRMIVQIILHVIAAGFFYLLIRLAGDWTGKEGTAD